MTRKYSTYEDYIDFIMAGNIAETAYVLSLDGTICGTNLPIVQMPRYLMDIQNENGDFTLMIVDEKLSLLGALDNNGISKQLYGIRLYNEKYYPICFDKSPRVLCLVKKNGGAIIMKTHQLIIIGTYNSKIKNSVNSHQNIQDLYRRIQTLSQAFIKMGY